MPAICFAPPEDGLPDPVRRAMSAIANAIDAERIVLAGAGDAFVTADLLVAEPGRGFVWVSVEPDPDRDAKVAGEQLGRALDRFWRQVQPPNEPEVRSGLLAPLAVVGETADDIPGPCLSFADLVRPEAVLSAYDESVDLLTAQPSRGLPARVARALAEKFGLVETLPPALAPAPDRPPVPAGPGHAPASDPGPGEKNDDLEILRGADQGIGAAARNRFARGQQKRVQIAANRRREEQDEADLQRKALQSYGLFPALDEVMVPPERLPGAAACREEIRQQLMGTDAEALARFANGTLKKLRERPRSDPDREGLLEAVEMLRAVSRERGLGLRLPRGQPENRALNARIAIAEACAGHFFDSTLAAERIVELYEARARDIDAVLNEIVDDPRCVGRPRTRPGNIRRGRRIRPDGKARRTLPDWVPLADTVGHLRTALANFAAIGDEPEATA